MSLAEQLQPSSVLCNEVSQMMAKERDEQLLVCPRCGADAQWSFIDPNKSRVEIMCPDCGRYEISREEFDQAVTEDAELHSPEDR